MTGLALSITPPPGPGWVRLLVEPPKRRFFGSKNSLEKPLTDWAAAQARAAFGPGSAPGSVSAYTDMLTRLARGGRERGEKLAFAWFPEPGGLPVAQITVSALGSADEAVTLDALAEQFGWRDSQTRSLEVERADLPAGPAVRVRREQATPDGGDGASDVAASVTYAFLPPQLNSALVFTMFWTLSDDQPALTEIADSTARTLRVENSALIGP